MPPRYGSSSGNRVDVSSVRARNRAVMELRSLHYFVRIAELGSITRASAHLQTSARQTSLRQTSPPGGVERGPLRGTGDFPGLLIDEPSGNGRSRLVARPLRGWQLRFLGQHQIAPFGKRSLSYRGGPRVRRLAGGAKEISNSWSHPERQRSEGATWVPPLLPVSELRAPEKRQRSAELSATASAVATPFHVGVPNAHTPIALSSIVRIASIVTGSFRLSSMRRTRMGLHDGSWT